MNYPAHVQVGPHRYTVVWDSDRLRELGSARGDGANCGEVWHTKLEILIRQDMPISQQQDTLLHEIIHAVTYVTGGWSDGDGKQTEEALIHQMCATLLDTLRRNPQVQWFLFNEG